MYSFFSMIRKTNVAFLVLFLTSFFLVILTFFCAFNFTLGAFFSFRALFSLLLLFFIVKVF